MCGVGFGFRFGFGAVSAHEQFEDGGGHEGGEHGHDDQGGEEGGGDDATGEADVDDDEFHEAAGVHEGADAQGVAVGEAGGACGEPAGDAFAADGGGEDQSRHQPEPGGVEQTDLGVEAGEGEEEGEQEGDGEGFDAGDEGLANEAAGHGGAHEEGAEDGVQPEEIGDAGSGGEQDEAEGEFGVGEVPAAFDASGPAAEERFEHAEGETDVDGAAENVECGVGEVAVEAGEDDGEQAPGGGVVDGPGAEGDGAHGGSGEFLEVDDARQHGEGGDAHGGAEEEAGFEEAGPSREEFGVTVEEPSEQGSEREGRGHAGDRDGDSAGEAASDDIDAELEADDEHVGGEAELGDGEEDPHGIGGEEALGEIGGGEPEQGRSEHDAGDHFGDHLGLAGAAGEDADDPAAGQDDHDLQEELDGEGGVAHDGGDFLSVGGQSRKHRLAISVMPWWHRWKQRFASRLWSCDIFGTFRRWPRI